MTDHIHDCWVCHNSERVSPIAFGDDQVWLCHRCTNELLAALRARRIAQLIERIPEEQR